MKRMSALIRLHEAGLWQGPNARLLDYIKYAYQIKNGNGFMGVFPVEIIRQYQGFEQSNGTIYLGVPNSLFQPVVGRDQIRDKNGKLSPLLVEKNIYATEHNMPVVYDDEELTVYELDRSSQAEIMEASSFEGCHVQIVGLGPVGLEVAVQASKMGIEIFSLYDPTKVLRTDPACSRYRVLDPEQSRITKAAEIINDGSLCMVEAYSRYPDGSDSFGDIVINTSYDLEVRKNLWSKIKHNDKIALYIDAQINNDGGKTFHFNPNDELGIETYEMELSEAENVFPNEIAYMVSMIGSFVTFLIKKHVGSISRQVAEERSYFIDMNLLEDVLKVK